MVELLFIIVSIVELLFIIVSMVELLFIIVSIIELLFIIVSTVELLFIIGSIVELLERIDSVCVFPNIADSVIVDSIVELLDSVDSTGQLTASVELPVIGDTAVPPTCSIVTSEATCLSALPRASVVMVVVVAWLLPSIRMVSSDRVGDSELG